MGSGSSPSGYDKIGLYHWDKTGAMTPAEVLIGNYEHGSGTDLDRFHAGADGGGIRRELGLGPEHALITQVGVRSWRGGLAWGVRTSRSWSGGRGGGV